MPRIGSPGTFSPAFSPVSPFRLAPFIAALFGLCLPGGGALLAAEAILPDFTDLEAAEHAYWTRALEDPFTRVISDLETGSLPLDTSNERDFVASFLKQLEIPASSQLLVFSTTSLQLSLISPRSPRALYFNEDIYLGFVPRGRIEIVSLDPEAGAIFYIFNIPRRPDEPVRVDRSNRCMNCHADAITRDVPGLVIQSVIPGPRGGSLDAFRGGEAGHHIPLSERFGGWYVTGRHSIAAHRGNATGRFVGGEIELFPVIPGETFDFDRYPVATSDILAHLIFEHQTGFVNRAVEASYLTRTLLRGAGDQLSPEQGALLDRKASELARYILFAGEIPLAGHAIEGDPAFTDAFLTGRRTSQSGDSLKDLDLETRLFRNRCSYMIYSRVFQGLPEAMKNRVYSHIHSALSDDSDAEFAYLPRDEKDTTLRILDDTLPDWRTQRGADPAD